MGKNEIEQFLSKSAIAKKAHVAARVVFRRDRMTPRELQEAFIAGAVELAGESGCELIAGDQVIARGEVIEKDGNYYFKAKEAAS